MKKFLLAPGQTFARLFREKKKKYRSMRHKPQTGPLVLFVSVIFWLSLLFVGFWLGILVKSAGEPGPSLSGGPEQIQSGAVGTTTTAERQASIPEIGSFLPGFFAGVSSAPGSSAAGVNTAPGAETTVATQSWLVILHTIPKNGQEGRAEAERRQARYRNQGLLVEVMDTGSFPRLRGGYWIVALGPFDSREEAAQKATEASRFSSDLMVKRAI